MRMQAGILLLVLQVLLACANRAGSKSNVDLHGDHHPAVAIRFEDPALVYSRDDGGHVGSMSLRFFVSGCVEGFDYVVLVLDVMEKRLWEKTFTASGAGERMEAEFAHPDVKIQHRFVVELRDAEPGLPLREASLAVRDMAFAPVSAPKRADRTEACVRWDALSGDEVRSRLAQCELPDVVLNASDVALQHMLFAERPEPVATIRLYHRSKLAQHFSRMRHWDRKLGGTLHQMPVVCWYQRAEALRFYQEHLQSILTLDDDAVDEHEQADAQSLLQLLAHTVEAEGMLVGHEEENSHVLAEKFLERVARPQERAPTRSDLSFIHQHWRFVLEDFHPGGRGLAGTEAHVANEVILSSKYRVAYIVVRKNANTAITRWLNHTLKGDATLTWCRADACQSFSGRCTSLCLDPAVHVQREGWLFFSFVQHPVRRFFKSLTTLMPRTVLLGQPALVRGIATRLLKILALRSHALDHHLETQSFSLSTPLPAPTGEVNRFRPQVRMDFIGRVESLEDDCRALIDFANRRPQVAQGAIPAIQDSTHEIPWLRKEHRVNESEKRVLWERLMSPQLISLAHETYAQDIVALGYGWLSGVTYAANESERRPPLV